MGLRWQLPPCRPLCKEGSLRHAFLALHERRPPKTNTRFVRRLTHQPPSDNRRHGVTRPTPREPSRNNVGQRPLTIAGNGLGQSSTAARPDADRPSRLRLARLFHCRIGEQLGTHPLRERDVTNSRRSNCPDSGHHFGTPKGVPITEYCDSNRLTTRERLKLFIPVCQAIQHAHQKGVIHRDIKPSNVLVTLYDGVPVPKVIDFGVAKATHQPLTEKTMFTELGQIIGTFEYMSPEQAEMNQLDVDTRSDVYSLGVLLYELLTGSTPISSRQLRRSGLDNMLRTLREYDPPKPSTRLSESKETLPTVSLVRRAEPTKLCQLVRGDLDWIAMKALEKDRTRRYDTANGLARDIDRFLRDEPVEASPPTSRYRFNKFARRNKGLLTSVCDHCLDSRDGHGREHVSGRMGDSIQQTGGSPRTGSNLGWRARKTSTVGRRATARGSRGGSAPSGNEPRLFPTSCLRSGICMSPDMRCRLPGDLNRVLSILNRHRPRSKEETDLRGWGVGGTCGSFVIRSRAERSPASTRRFAVSRSARMEGLLPLPPIRGRIELRNLTDGSLVAERDGLQRRYRAPTVFLPMDGTLSPYIPRGSWHYWMYLRWKNGSCLRTGEAYVSDVAFSPNGQLLAASCANRVILWKLGHERTSCLHEVQVGLSGLDGNCEFSPDNSMLYVVVGAMHRLWAYDIAPLGQQEDYQPKVLFTLSEAGNGVAVVTR